MIGRDWCIFFWGFIWCWLTQGWRISAKFFYSCAFSLPYTPTIYLSPNSFRSWLWPGSAICIIVLLFTAGPTQRAGYISVGQLRLACCRTACSQGWRIPSRIFDFCCFFQQIVSLRYILSFPRQTMSLLVLLVLIQIVRAAYGLLVVWALELLVTFSRERSFASCSCR